MNPRTAVDSQSSEKECGVDRKLLLRHLAEAERHVAEGDDQIALQKDVIAELERNGLDSSSAKEALSRVEATQWTHVIVRDRIRQELDGE